MSEPFKYQREESPLRKNFDSFTSKDKLRDTQEEFAQAIYRFREAEDADAPDRIALKREMEFLDRKVRFYRYCIYHNQTIDGYAEYPALHTQISCPKPEWTYIPLSKKL